MQVVHIGQVAEAAAGTAGIQGRHHLVLGDGDAAQLLHGRDDLVGGDVSGAVRDLLEDGPEQPLHELRVLREQRRTELGEAHHAVPLEVEGVEAEVETRGVVRSKW